MTFDGRPVLDGVSLTVPPGHRVGLVGENGSGKSTLLACAAGVLTPSAGSVTTPADLGYLPQDGGLDPGATVGEVLRDALAPLHRLAAEVERLATHVGAHPDDAAASASYDDALSRAVAREAWDADRRAEVAAHRLGLEALPHDRPVARTSGGQRSRLALAALLVRRPDALLLDEPTNHLDDDALDFLESELVAMPGAVLVASHDRVLLERACTGVVDLDPRHRGTDGVGGATWTGSFAEHRAAKAAARRRWEAEWLEQRELVADLRGRAETRESSVAHGRGPTDNDKFIHAFRGSRVQTAARRRARDAEQRLLRIERDPVPRPPAPLRLDVDLGRAGGGDAGLRVRDLVVPGRLQLARLDVAAGEHVLVTGRNGSGKSTLLRALAEPGRHRGVEVGGRVARLAQDTAFPDPRRSPQVLVAAALGVAVEDARAALLPLGLVHPRDVARPVGDLSLGQQRRLALALVVLARPDVLLLDEPTNHLSLTLVDELEAAVDASPATILVASHDRWLRRRWTGRTISLDSR
ncbi:ABC-F family ATP-binding cassette domain-containing protein [Phycicoccus sp. MQZ13P-5]|uniref:ABC-F family ATP-binding cassette domain-containing protein n=2 Tax=Phycicoccus sonneratiae TaxID=2807628 RepID=A0ABS2CMV3_9MICO|nr:ABC-F family ATP-binding cassette domain-containing protein [Phycicoccus sonneraticus]